MMTAEHGRFIFKNTEATKRRMHVDGCDVDMYYSRPTATVHRRTFPQFAALRHSLMRALALHTHTHERKIANPDRVTSQPATVQKTGRDQQWYQEKTKLYSIYIYCNGIRVCVCVPRKRSRMGYIWPYGYSTTTVYYYYYYYYYYNNNNNK
uniref:Uncharacterized protein n=1 Tax=Schizaphis graminum TaxID=13262 RepID=A0A2S2NJ10_SCHGA